MDDLSRKKRHKTDNATAGTASLETLHEATLATAEQAPAVTAAAPARVRRTSAAVKRALPAIATAQPQLPVQAVPDTPAADAGASRPKLKLVRTSFSLAKDDHATLGALKEACRARGVGAKKSQLLRVAVDLLREVEPARLAQLVAALPAPARKRK